MSRANLNDLISSTIEGTTITRISLPAWIAYALDTPSNSFEICSNFTVYKYETFQAFGPVADYTQFTLANIKENDDVNEKIIKALDIVSRNSQLVGCPYLLIDTKTNEYKLIRGENI